LSLLLFVRVYVYSWAFNHKLKLLVELVLEHDTRTFLSERSRVQISIVPIFITGGMEGSLQHPHFKLKGHSREGAC